MKNYFKLFACLICIILIFTSCSSISTSNHGNKVIVSDQVSNLAEATINDLDKGQVLDSNKTIPNADADEYAIEDEEGLEVDASSDQDVLSYDGSESGKGLKLLGKCTGPTYYSQADSRWGNVIYTSSGNSSQTIKNSGCGPTSAAMVVSSSKGKIIPTTMAKLFVDNNYRTKNNGTAWSAWNFVADYFDFKEFHTTSNVNTALKYLKQDANRDGLPDYYVVASCGSGLFTYGGHYIVLAGYKNNKITVYDPYLYNNKFNTPSRKVAKVKVSGTTVTLTESSFKKYSKTKNFWIYSNDHVKSKPKTTTKNTIKKTTKKPITTKPSKKKTYTMYVKTKDKSSKLNVRSSNSKSSKILAKLSDNSKVTVDIKSKGWYHINSPHKGWVNSEYLTSKKSTPKKYKKINAKSGLNAYLSMSAKSPKLVIKYGTKVEILSNNSGTKVIKSKKYNMSKIKYKGNIYYVASNWLK